MVLLALLLSCKPAQPLVEDSGPNEIDPPPQFDPVAALEDFECYGGTSGCAEAGPHIEGTCCTYGSTLPALSIGTAAEAVDVQLTDQYAFLCGGFGMRINDISDPADPTWVGSTAGRCQHTGVGPVTSAGEQVVYLSHHGDSWVEMPSLHTYRLTPDGVMEPELLIDDPNLLFEDLVWHDNHLYVAVHEAGVRVYETDANGRPSYTQTIEFGNAQRLDVHGDKLYVVDENLLTVVDIADPTAPQRVGTAELAALGRDVDVDGDRAYVAVGSQGLVVVDVSDPAAMSTLHHITPDGSVMGVSVDDGLVATANWTHIQLRRADDLLLIGTKKTRVHSAFEQDFSIAMKGGRVYVAEWEKLRIFDVRRGYVAPDLWLRRDMLDFYGDEPYEQVLRVHNRGPLPLTIEDIIQSEGSGFAVEPTSLVVQPGELGEIAVGFEPGVSESGWIQLLSDDPDPEQSVLPVPLYSSSDAARLNVGDKLTGQFGFLDPTGAGDLSNLEGKVTVLAYFALF